MLYPEILSACECENSDLQRVTGSAPRVGNNGGKG